MTARCQATRLDGQPCEAFVASDTTGLCAAHNPDSRALAAEHRPPKIRVKRVVVWIATADDGRQWSSHQSAAKAREAALADLSAQKGDEVTP